MSKTWQLVPQRVWKCHQLWICCISSYQIQPTLTKKLPCHTEPLLEPEYKLILSIFIKHLTSKELITSEELLPEAVPTDRASGWTFNKPGGSEHSPWLWSHQEWPGSTSKIQRKGFKVIPILLGQTLKSVLKPSPGKGYSEIPTKGFGKECWRAVSMADGLQPAAGYTN